ncbi:MAG: Rv2175c family DNA-binding protein [Kineosporiaceae bacterium]
MDELDELVTRWLPLPDVAEQLGVDVIRVRRLIQDRFLIAVRRGERGVLSVPAEMLRDGEVMAEMPGTLNVLADAGYTPDEALRWLVSPDETLPGSPLEALRAGRKTEIRRRAQALAF